LYGGEVVAVVAQRLGESEGILVFQSACHVSGQILAVWDCYLEVALNICIIQPYLLSVGVPGSG
jgi:hypothetical protein